jgi:hypothetical protein
MDLAREQLLVEDHTSSVMTQAKAFQKQQKEIDAETFKLTGSTISDEAVKRLQGPMENIQQVDIAFGYVQLLQKVDKLR